MLIRQTVPPPVVPSNTKKFTIGDSRAASALRMSCASMPPTTAQTGESSCAAVVARDLKKRQIQEYSSDEYTASTHWTFSRGTLGKACLLTSAFARTAFAASSRAGVAPALSGREL